MQQLSPAWLGWHAGLVALHARDGISEFVYSLVWELIEYTIILIVLNLGKHFFWAREWSVVFIIIEHQWVSAVIQ